MSKSKSPHRAIDVARLRLIGMVHLPPLPGSAGAARTAAARLTGRTAVSMAEIVSRAVSEAVALARAGFDAVIVENFGDSPFAADRVTGETIAAMSVVADQVVRACGLPVGVNVLRNDAMAGLAVAAASGAAFIRVNVLSGAYATDQGVITGRADELMRRRAAVAPRVAVAADVHVKHAVPINQPKIALAAEETAYRAGADVLIVSGVGTGKSTDTAAVRRVKEAAPDRPVWIGSGVTASTVRDDLKIADGVIVGTFLKRGGRTTAPLDPARLRAFIHAARRK